MANIPPILIRAQWRLILLRVVLVSTITKLVVSIVLQATFNIAMEGWTVLHHLLM